MTETTPASNFPHEASPAARKGKTVVIVGGGIFGVTAALELRHRGYSVQLLDPGPLPHPLAESTDISKAVRMDYGPDEDYMALMEKALLGWRAWNSAWPQPLFHEDGVTYLTRAPMSPGGFEYESYRLLRKRGHRPTQLFSAEIGRRFPAWNSSLYTDGYYNPEGGFAQSGRVVAQLIEGARAGGVAVHPGQAFAHFLERGSRVSGVATRAGSRFEADQVVIAAGAWVPKIMPELVNVFRTSGMPVFHLKPADPELFRAGRFPSFGADISATGYYGFPLHPIEGVVKVANHGPGRIIDPDSSARSVTDEQTSALRDFLGETFPALATAPIVYTRVCIYCDTWDGHLWIDRDPSREGVTVATGGSGHAFKFAPVLGSIIADAMEGAPNPILPRFRWRPEVRMTRTEEAARWQEQSKRGYAVEITKTLYVAEREKWRAWLSQHYLSEKEIWLVYYRKGSGKPRIAYNDAVEEALCFGWIDSTVKKLDDERFAQRFSPRKPGAEYSPANKERLRALIAQGRVAPEVLETLGDLSPAKLEIAPDVLAAIKENKLAWKNFRRFPEPYKRIRIGFIEGARKRPEEFMKRLRYFVKMTEQNKMYGFGGIEKHFQ